LKESERVEWVNGKRGGRGGLRNCKKLGPYLLKKWGAKKGKNVGKTQKSVCLWANPEKNRNHREGGAKWEKKGKNLKRLSKNKRWRDQGFLALLGGGGKLRDTKKVRSG